MPDTNTVQSAKPVVVAKPAKTPGFKPKLLPSRWKKSELWAFRNIRGTKETLLKAVNDFRFPAKSEDPAEVRTGLPADVLTYLTWVVNSRADGQAFEMDCKADSADGSDFVTHLHLRKIF